MLADTILGQVMIKLLGSIVAFFVLATAAQASEPQTGYSSYFYHRHDHYHRHYHRHFYGPPVEPHYFYRRPYTFEGSYVVPPRYRKKRTGRSDALGPNWYYCKSYWRRPVNMTSAKGRFWWPFYNPRPVKEDPCKYRNYRKPAPGYRPY